MSLENLRLENLKSTPHEELRRALLGALAQLRSNPNHPRLIPYHTLLAHTENALGRPGLLAAIKERQLGFVMQTAKPVDEHYDNAAILAAVWSLVADGTIVPRLQSVGNALNNGRDAVEIGYVSVTPQGDALLTALPRHPRFPGGLQPLVTRHPSLEEEIAPRLDDAARCIDKGLARPAIVMIGLAVETAVQNAEETLTKAGKWPQPPNARINQQQRIGLMTKAIELHYTTKEAKHRLTLAMSLVEQVRVKRNLAAHDPAQTFVVEQADRLLVAAVSEIETIYDLIVDPKSP